MCVCARTRADRPLVPILSNNIPNWGFPDLETANFLSLSRAQHNATVITAAKWRDGSPFNRLFIERAPPPWPTLNWGYPCNQRIKNLNYLISFLIFSVYPIKSHSESFRRWFVRFVCDNKDARSKGESFSFLLTYGEDVLEDYVDLKKVYKFSMLF